MDQPRPGGAKCRRFTPRRHVPIPRQCRFSPSDFGYLLLAGALEASGDKTQAARARQKAILLSNNISAAQRHADKLLAQ